MTLGEISLASLCSWAGRFESYLVGNPKDRFSRDVAHMSQLMRLWYLSHRPPAKAQMSLRIRAVLSEPLLPMRSHPVGLDAWFLVWMAVHGSLKNEFTEDKKSHNLLSRLIYCQSCGLIAMFIALSVYICRFSSPKSSAGQRNDSFTV